MTNKYLYFVANWKMYGDLKTLNSLDKIIKFSEIIKHNKTYTLASKTITESIHQNYIHFSVITHKKLNFRLKMNRLLK